MQSFLVDRELLTYHIDTYVKIHNLYMTHFVNYITRKLRSKLDARRCRKTKLFLLRKIIFPYQRESLAQWRSQLMNDYAFFWLYSQVIAQENCLAAFFLDGALYAIAISAWYRSHIFLGLIPKH